jgi:hypothetical protein
MLQNQHPKDVGKDDEIFNILHLAIIEGFFCEYKPGITSIDCK